MSAGQAMNEQAMTEDHVSRFRMEYGVPAVLVGWLVTFLAFCLGLTVANLVAEGADGLGLGFMVLSLMFGLPVAVLIGLPLALLISWPLRRVPNQWLHVVAFALGVGAAMVVGVYFSYGSEMNRGVAALVAGAALSAAIGRASVITMVAKRNQLGSLP